MTKDPQPNQDPLETHSGRTLFLALSAKIILMLAAIIYCCFTFASNPDAVYDWRSYLPIIAAFLIGFILLRFAFQVISHQTKEEAKNSVSPTADTPKQETAPKEGSTHG